MDNTDCPTSMTFIIGITQQCVPFTDRYLGYIGDVHAVTFTALFNETQNLYIDL